MFIRCNAAVVYAFRSLDGQPRSSKPETTAGRKATVVCCSSGAYYGGVVARE